MREYRFGPDSESYFDRREELFRNGPCLDVSVIGLHHGQPGAPSFTAFETPLIGKSPARALIDTGADMNAIDRKLALRVGMAQTGTANVSGMTGSGVVPTYLGRVFIPELDRTVGGEFYSAQLSGRPYRIILGRTFLEDFIFRYDGPDARFYLTPVQFGSPSDHA